MDEKECFDNLNGCMLIRGQYLQVLGDATVRLTRKLSGVGLVSQVIDGVAIGEQAELLQLIISSAVVLRNVVFQHRFL